MSILGAAIAAIPKSLLLDGGQMALAEALKVLAVQVPGPKVEFAVKEVGDLVHITAVPSAPAAPPASNGSVVTPRDLSGEAWREYDFGGRIYRVSEPKSLYMRPGGTTHRVLDSEGVVHCVPAPGQCGCVLRWKSKDGQPPVNF